jgi:hypothetical protein
MPLIYARVQTKAKQSETTTLQGEPMEQYTAKQVNQLVADTIRTLIEYGDIWCNEIEMDETIAHYSKVIQEGYARIGLMRGAVE